jgi:hypothetical protein
MFWEPERHEEVTDTPWDEERAMATVRAIAADAAGAFDEESLWPHHPLDDLGLPGPRTGIYVGASGVAWALHQLGKRSAVELDRDWIETAGSFVDIYRHRPETPEPVPSLMLGELGPRMVADADRERIFELIESNIDNPTLEMLWGAPGTMLPALFLFERTGEQQWRDLYLRNVDHLMETWAYHEDRDVWLWTQELYGHTVRLLGAGHGFAGNVYSMARGFALLSEEQRETVRSRTRYTVLHTAHRTAGTANWPQHVGEGRPGRDAWLVQWCHGAPGMITSLAGLPEDEGLSEALLAGGELTWRVGPLRKGPGICHGTAGNGYAFLALHARSGDDAWLERARCFAMHAIEQVEAARDEHGVGRYSLWTGDLGVAIYLLDCIEGAGEIPTLGYM